jgi:hypothetical protein
MFSLKLPFLQEPRDTTTQKTSFFRTALFLSELHPMADSLHIIINTEYRTCPGNLVCIYCSVVWIGNQFYWTLIPRNGHYNLNISVILISFLSHVFTSLLVTASNGGYFQTMSYQTVHASHFRRDGGRCVGIVMSILALLNISAITQLIACGVKFRTL